MPTFIIILGSSVRKVAWPCIVTGHTFNGHFSTMPSIADSALVPITGSPHQRCHIHTHRQHCRVTLSWFCQQGTLPVCVSLQTLHSFLESVPFSHSEIPPTIRAPWTLSLQIQHKGRVFIQCLDKSINVLKSLLTYLCLPLK